jgi:exonuclease SbcC
MKFLHTSDIHFSREHQTEALASLTVLAETTERERPALVAISGDLFDRGLVNSTAAGFPSLLAVIQRILDVCPIAAVRGTPTHDLPGCYDALARLHGPRGGFSMIEAHNTVFHCNEQGNHDLLILGIPEPSREWLLAGKEGASAAETAEAMKVALRSILLGLGAIRAAHPDLPAVFLFHGPISGASFQNGQVIGAGEITIDREDLALVGADYYALGHIHLAQQIPGLPAYYPGSAYPVNWGELGQNGFNLVEIKGGGPAPATWEGEPTTVGFLSFVTEITRIDYPHLRRVKYVIHTKDPQIVSIDGPVRGLQVWVVLKGTKEELESPVFDEDMLEALGALPGSRVTTELIPTETVRAAEITEKHRLREKVAVYAEASATEKTSFIPNIAESILLKADQLECEAEEQGATAGFHFRLRQLRLRGSIGVWKGLRKDEVDYNLDAYDPGLIAMIGINGSAKSTVIENMHPYSCMLTRRPASPTGPGAKGRLQDHFRLRDSARELWFIDERTGAEYRTLTEIDGANATGSIKYHLFKNGEPITNGRKEDYDVAIERMLGSFSLFLRSAFVSQKATKSNPDLGDATEDKRKAMFRELAGLGFLQAYKENSGANAKQLESSVATGRAQAEVLERFVAEEPSIESVIASANDDIQTADAKLADLTTQGKELREKVDTLAVLVVEQDTLGRDIDSAANGAQVKFGQVETARTKIEGYQSALNLREVAQENVDYHAHLKEQEGKENERLSEVNKERTRLVSEFNDAIKTHRDHATKLQSTKAQISTSQATRKGERNVVQAKVDHAEAELSRPAKACPKCGYVDPAIEKDRAATKVLLEDWARGLVELDHGIEVLSRQLKEAEANIIALVEPEKSPLPPADETELKRIRAELAEIDIAKNRSTLETAAKAEQEIATLKAQIATLENDANELTLKAGKLRSQLDPAIKPAHEEVVKQLEEVRTAFTTAKADQATAVANLKTAQKQLEAIEKQKCKLDELKGSLAKIEAEAAEWRYLEVACGPDGIQALELDAMGPGISEVANRLLSAAYGSRFSIELRTTRIAGKGSRTKQVEDFAIIVLDNELLTEQPIETLSGGESVWIKRALYDAFAIIRDKTTGLRFLTAFQDEADGALDPESRQHYFAMLEAAHQESGRRHTIIVTHSAEIQEMISQRIVMRKADTVSA